MRIVIDIEANRLINPDKIWIIVCKDIDTGEYHIFRRVTDDASEKQRFVDFASRVTLWVGHNFLGYDWDVLVSCLGLSVPDISLVTLDTLIISKMVDYSRKGHSIEDYGLECGREKGKFSDWSKYSKDLS